MSATQAEIEQLNISSLFLSFPGIRPGNFDFGKLIRADIDLENSDSLAFRRDFFKNILIGFKQMLSMGLKYQTISTRLNHLNIFFGFCAAQSEHYFSNDTDLLDLFRNYQAHLNEKVRRKKLSPNTPASYLGDVKASLMPALGEEARFELEKFVIPKKTLALAKMTEAPSKTEAIEYIDLCKSIFSGIADFVLNSEPYPLFLNTRKGKYCHFPVSYNSWKRVDQVASKEEASCGFLKVFDFSKGVLLSRSEILEKNERRKLKHARAYAGISYRSAAKRMEEVNSNPVHWRRLSLYNFSLQAFLMMFFSATGMNFTQVKSLNWSKSIHKINRENVRFLAVKHRAKGRVVEFVIAKGFLKYFEKFLKLREFIISSLDIQADKLFFFVRDGKARSISSTLLTVGFHERLKNNFDFHTRITSKQWRQLRAEWAFENGDLFVASDLLQNRSDTFVRHYLNSSIKKYNSEMSSFFEQFEGFQLLKSEQGTSSLSVGQCIQSGTPDPVQPSQIYQVNCKDVEGCLFCKNYGAIQSDDAIKKLLSYRYVCEQLFVSRKNKMETERYFRGIFERIDTIVNAICELDQGLATQLSSIRRRIYKHQELHPFWEQKLSMYIDLELA